jgi:Spy/CpxP family protein refolding chaperone
MGCLFVCILACRLLSKKVKGKIFYLGEQTMKKATKVTMAAMALLFVAVMATSAFGFGWGRGPGVGCGTCGGDIAGYPGLELTADQKAQLEAMRGALREQMFAKRDEVRKLWLESNPDQANILAAQKEMRSLRDQLQDKMTAFRLDALKVLTPEQREKLKSAVPGRGFGTGRGMGPGACGGCPGDRGNR